MLDPIEFHSCTSKAVEPQNPSEAVEPQNPSKAVEPLRGCRLLILPLLASLLVGCAGQSAVETIQPRVKRIEESFKEPAKTRLARSYHVNMPISARVDYISLEPGTMVKKGQLLAKIDDKPFELAVSEAQAIVDELKASLVVQEYDKMEQSALEESKAVVSASDEALKASTAQIEAQQARMERATKELARAQKLAKSKAIPQSELDDAQLTADTAIIDLKKEEFNKAALKALISAVRLYPRVVEEYMGKKKLEKAELAKRIAAAEVRLEKAQYELALTKITSPIDGIVLERFEKGERMVEAGVALLSIGSLDELEITADVLTIDAMKLKKGSKVELESLPNEPTFWGKVKRIEPSGFTKLSSLGVEQQRVRIVVEAEMKSIPKNLSLGVGFRLHARFITGEKSSAVVIPRASVMQAPDGSFFVYKVLNDKLVRQSIRLGLQSDMELEIVSGLVKGQAIVARPDSNMEDGMAVKVATP